jgi:hypothetical protein
MLVGLFALLSVSAHAQNTSFGTAVHLLVGQSPMRVTLPVATPDRFYDAPVVANRSYCAEATGSESELNTTDPTLTIFAADQSTPLGIESGNLEPKGLTASRVCFIAPATETIYIRISPVAGFENREYSLRFLESTLWTNWWFVGSDYSSYTIMRNTTNAPVTVNLRWRGLNGTEVGTQLGQVIPANGTVFYNARDVMSCPFPTPCVNAAGSVEIAHTASPEAIVGSQTTLASSTGLSFDTLLFQRRAW